jgi:membrane protein
MQKSKLDHPVFIAALAAAGLLLKPYRPPPHDLAPAKPHPFKRRVAGREQAADSSRGQDADSPTEIPARGWWDVIKRVARDVSENQLMTQAAAITFYALLSFFPALAALVSIYGLIADPATIMKQVDALSGVLPGGGQELLTEELKSLTSASNGGLGWGLILGLATSLWTSNQAMKALFGALNVVHEEHEKRSFFKLTALTLACTAGVVLFMIVALIGVVVVPAVLNFVGLGGVTEVLIKWLRWPVLLLIVGVLLAALYRYGPSRETAKWRWVSYGSAFAAILWVIVSLLFSWYVANFGNYNKTYGSLGAVVGFMTWIWISSTVVLIGAQLDAELEKQTARDTTTGPERPLGTRGAAPADQVASTSA